MTDEELIKAAEEFIYEEFRFRAFVNGYKEKDGVLVFDYEFEELIEIGYPYDVKYDGKKFYTELVDWAKEILNEHKVQHTSH